MDRSVTVKLGTFAAEALTGEHRHGRHGTATAGNGNKATAEGVLRAVRLYLHDREVDSPGWAYPGFLRGHKPSEELEFDLDIDEALWQAVEREAHRQGVGIPQLLEHAALYYAAELDAGRVTGRILDELEDG